MIRLFAALLITVAGLVAAAAEARQDDPRLDPLFEKLLGTADGETANMIQASIWGIWVESGDDEIDGRMRHGILAMRFGRFETALRDFDAVVEADPEFAEGWNKRATLFYLMEDFDSSVRDVERTLTLEPRHFGALSGMGLIYSAVEDDEAALDWFERALIVNPHMSFIRQRTLTLRQKLRGEPI